MLNMYLNLNDIVDSFENKSEQRTTYCYIQDPDLNLKYPIYSPISH